MAMIAIPTLAFGVLLRDMIRNMGVSNASASWTVAISLAVSQVVAPFATISIHVFSSRKTVFTGGILICIGMFLSAFAPNIVVLSITFGVITGIGIGISRVPCLVIGSQYFPKSYGIIAGITFSGFSIGRLAFTPVVQLANDTYGYQGTYMLIAGICLNVCVGAALFQPVRNHMVWRPIEPKPNATAAAAAKEAEAMKDKRSNAGDSPAKGGAKPAIEMKEMNKNLLNVKRQDQQMSPSRVGGGGGSSVMDTTKMDYDTDDSESMARIARSGDIFSSVDSLDRVGQVTPKKQLPVVSPAAAAAAQPKLSKMAFYKKQLKSSLDFSLLKEPVFYLILISSVLTYLTILYSNVFLVPLGVDKKFTPMAASLVLTAKSGAEIAGRLGFPFVQKYLKLNPVLFFAFICVLVAILLMIQALVTSYEAFMAFGILAGIMTGGTVVSNMQVTLISVGVKKFPSTIGMCSFIQGFFALVTGPLLGYVKDVTGSFVSCYLMIVGLQVISSLLWFGRFFYVWRQQRQQART